MIKTIHVTPASISLNVLLRNRLAKIASNGFEIMGFSTDDIDGKRFQNSNFKFIPSKYLTRKFNIIKDVKFFFESYKIFKKEKSIIVNTYGPKPGLYGRIAAKICGVPIVVHTSWGLFFNEDSSWVKKIFFILLEKFSALFCDYIFSVNKDDLELMKKYRVKRVDRFGYLGNATDVWNIFNPKLINKQKLQSLREKFSIEAEKIVIGMVARLVYSKGYKEFFEAARFLKSKYKNLVFICVGPFDFSKRDSISEAIIKKLEERGIIKFLGEQKNENMPYIYSLMDIVVLPSYREGFPRSLVEAAAMGKPLVATDIRGCREAIDHGINGFLVPLKDWKALADAIEKLIVNEELRKKMGKESRKKALREFDEDKLVKKIINVYNKLLQEKGFLLKRNNENQKG